MTAGIVHLVAPNAGLMPLKAFNANGTGYASDVLRAMYLRGRKQRQSHQHELRVHESLFGTGQCDHVRYAQQFDLRGVGWE